MSGAVLSSDIGVAKHWSSPQRPMALSSCEAELYSMNKGAAEAMGIRSFFRRHRNHVGNLAQNRRKFSAGSCQQPWRRGDAPLCHAGAVVAECDSEGLHNGLLLVSATRDEPTCACPTSTASNDIPNTKPAKHVRCQGQHFQHHARLRSRSGYTRQRWRASTEESFASCPVSPTTDSMERHLSFVTAIATKSRRDRWEGGREEGLWCSCSTLFTSSSVHVCHSANIPSHTR